MDDGNQTVGASGVTGAAGQPAQPVSPTPTPPIQGDVSQLLAGLESKFSEQFGNLQKELRGLQGRQDKSENSFQEQLARLQQYESQGYSRADALKEMESDDAYTAWQRSIEKKLDDVLAGRIAGVGPQANGQQQAVANVFSQKGLDLTDQRVKEALAKEYKDLDAIELAAYRLKELTVSPQSNQAQNASLSGGAAGGSGVNDKIAQLQELQKRPSQNMTEIIKLTKELDASGWK